MDVENYIFFGLKLGSGFEETGGTPPPRIHRSTPPPPNSNSSAHVTIQFTKSFPFVLAFRRSSYSFVCSST